MTDDVIEKQLEHFKKQKGKKAAGPKVEAPPKAATDAPEAEKQPEERPQRKSGDSSKDAVDDDEAVTELPPQQEGQAEGPDDDEPRGETPPGGHDREPSLSIQSKLRSSSFRQGPLSPSLGNVKPPNLPPLSPEGDTMTEIYRKQASRLEQLEKDNRRLQTELGEEETRRRKTEDEVEELREFKSELAMLREQAQRAGGLEGTLEKMVRRADRSPMRVSCF